LKVSVIIPVKNRANLLPVTLNNILGQTLKPYEVIVVDDRSTDAISDVISAFQSSVIFTKSKGSGPGAARNTGLSIATGNLIQFFDSDDLMTRNKLQVQAELLHEKNADFIYGPWVKAVNENGVWEQSDVIMQYFPITKGLLADYVLKGWCNITQSVLFKRDLIDEAGIWREDLMPHEDFEFWFRIGKVAKSYFHENRSCVIYRQHQQQITDKEVSDKARWLDGLKARDIIEKEIDYKPSLNSLILFKADSASSKFKFIKKYGKGNCVQISTVELAYQYISRIQGRFGKFLTGTPWQKMHGVLREKPEIFSNYVNQMI
jgi:glycosyltransferase involved in cell wall biosynthesis